MTGCNSQSLCNGIATDKSTSDESLTRHSYFYLTPQAVNALPKYQYDGGDTSIIYKYVLSPLALFLVENCTPRSIAPNTITLFGLVFMITAYNLIWYHCPSLDECSLNHPKSSEIPDWIFGFNGVAMLIYQTLDNMDGKQARRTGSASPLGLLFDHGIDATNSIFGSVNWICAMGLSPLISDQRWQIYVMIFFPMAAFFMSTWEEYYTGKMILPAFNGPTEGLLIGASLSLISWWYGREFWHDTQIYDTLVLSWLPPVVGDYLPKTAVVNYNMVLFTTVVATIRETLDRLSHVVGKYGLWSVEHLFPAVFLLIASVPIIYSDLFARNPRTCLHLFAVLFVDMVSSLMLAHCCHVNYDPYRLLLCPFAILSICACMEIETKDEMKIDQILFAYAVGSFTYLSMKFRLVIHEVCHVLGIWCFDILTPYGYKEE